jgi:hypothetical protein
VCRAHGRSLLGAAPAELLGEVPDRWVVAAGDAQLAAWQAVGDDPPYAELTVLTACRVWRFAEQGRHCSKAAPPTGRWGVTPPSGWVLTPSTSATATRPPGSTPRRCNSCWRCSEHGSPRRATAPSWGIPAGDADEGAGGGGDFVGGQEHGRGRHLSSRRERPSSHMASNGAGSPLTAPTRLLCLGVVGRLVAATLSGRRAQLVDGGGELAWIGDRKAVPEASQPGSQLGKVSGRAPILLVVR